MQTYQYKVVPAPKAGLKAKGVRSNEDRFALALETLMNELGAQGWDYVRTDTLPAEERQGLTGRTTVYQNMLVFRRGIDIPAPRAEPVYVPQLSIPAPAAVSVRLVAPDDTVIPAPAPGPRLVAE